MILMAMPSSSCFFISSPQHGFGNNRSSKLQGTKYVTSWDLHAKLNQVRVMDWRMPLPTITTTFRKPLMMLKCTKKDLDQLVSDIGLGGLVKVDAGFRQKIYIRLYEVGPDRKTLVETIMNYLQETITNHFRAVGLNHDGMASTPEMSKRNLQWVTAKMHVIVDHYPTWGDVLQVDTWNAMSGKYGLRSSWMFCDCKTDKILVRASGIFMMMNKKTRRLSKIPDEVRVELKRILVDRPLIVEEDTRKWTKEDESIIEHVRNGIMPRWSDLDANQHVNNVKYIGWILESVPMTIMEKYELASMTLEYHRECRKDDVLKCQTCMLRKTNDGIAEYNYVDCQHLLQLEGGGSSSGNNNGDVILKGKTKWRPKYEHR